MDNPFRTTGLLVHAPGAILASQDQPGRAAFTVQGWSPRPYFLLIAGLKGTPSVRINGQETPLTAPHQRSTTYAPSE